MSDTQAPPDPLRDVRDLAHRLLTTDLSSPDLAGLAEKLFAATRSAAAASETLKRYDQTLERMGRPTAAQIILPEFAYSLTTG